MICRKCDKDLANCFCDDMPERFESVKQSPYIALGSEYLARLEAQAEKVRHSRPQKEVSE